MAAARLRRWEWLLIALVGLTAQAFWLVQLAHPSYMDAYYYTTNGQRLAAGYGFTEEIIWQYLDEPDGLPTPSHSYWMPLPSLLAAAGYRLADSFRGAQLPFWLLAGLLPLLAVVISQELNLARWQTWTAALFTASGGFYARFFSQPSTFAPFAWAGGMCLLALARGGKWPYSWRWWSLAGLMAGLANLTRADGLLLLFIGLAIIGYRLWRNSSDYRSPVTDYRLLLTGLLPLCIGYLLVMGGWFARNWLVLGRPLSTAGAQTVFLTTYDDLFAYGRFFGPAHLLDWGWSNILYSRLRGLSLAVQTFVAVTCLIFLTPFVLWGWWRLRRTQRDVIRPLTWYTLALFLAMSLVFTFPGSRGGLFHSSAALWPWFMPLGAAGIGYAVDWTAARLSHWQPARAKRTFAALFVAVAAVTSVALNVARAETADTTTIYAQIGRQLPDDAVVVVGDAPAFHYHTGLSAISLPNEPEHLLVEVARRYGAGYVVVDKDHPRSLRHLYRGEPQGKRLEVFGRFGDVWVYRIR